MDKNFDFSTAPLLIGPLFVVFWVALFGTAFQNRQDQDFAANGVSQIQTAKEMDDLYDDCRHYVSYGPNNVPLFSSVAYFGDRYTLTMQVPVRIRSKTSGKTIGESAFYLEEIDKISDSPSGQMSASFSDNLDFGAVEWKRVYEAKGDLGRIGFIINPNGVPNFHEYIDVSQPCY